MFPEMLFVIFAGICLIAILRQWCVSRRGPKKVRVTAPGGIPINNSSMIPLPARRTPVYLPAQAQGTSAEVWGHSVVLPNIRGRTNTPSYNQRARAARWSLDRRYVPPWRPTTTIIRPNRVRDPTDDDDLLNLRVRVRGKCEYKIWVGEVRDLVPGGLAWVVLDHKMENGFLFPAVALQRVDEVTGQSLLNVRPGKAF